MITGFIDKNSSHPSKSNKSEYDKKSSLSSNEHPQTESSSHSLHKSVPVQQKQNDIYVQNVNINNDNNKAIIIQYDKNEHKIILHDMNKRLLGYFTGKQLIKYITQHISSTFLNNIEMGTSSYVISSFVLNITPENEILIVNHVNSPLTGNIDIMMKIYTMIELFKQNINQELTQIENSFTILNLIEQLEIIILKHSLKLISTISEIIKLDHSKQDLKIMLIKYSVMITNKLNGFLNEKLTKKINEHITLKTELQNIEKTHVKLEERINVIEEVILKQNSYITKIFSIFNDEEKKPYPIQQGGDDDGEPYCVASGTEDSIKCLTPK
jgi:hypothetical protein